MVNLDEMIKRLLKRKGLSQNKEAAEILGISAADLSNRKRRGTLFPLLIEWAINEKINLQWFVTGEEPEHVKTKESRKYEILDEAEEWLNEEIRKNPNREPWFEVELLDSFPKFREWRRKRAEEKDGEDEYPASKVA